MLVVPLKIVVSLGLLKYVNISFDPGWEAVLEKGVDDRRHICVLHKVIETFDQGHWDLGGVLYTRNL